MFAEKTKLAFLGLTCVVRQIYSLFILCLSFSLLVCFPTGFAFGMSLLAGWTISDAKPPECRQVGLEIDVDVFFSQSFS